MDRKVRIVLLPILLLLFSFLLYRALLPPEILTVHFMDVGQGDAILIQSPGATALIDGGARFSWTQEYLLQYLQEQQVEFIDILVATHPHADHIGGLLAVLEHFPVGAVYDSGRSHTTQTFLDYLLLVEEKEIPFFTPRRGEVISGGDLEFTVLHPAGDVEEYSLNNASIVIRLEFGQVCFLFTGDMEAQAEEEVLESHLPFHSNILKVAHHGSRTSTTAAFLQAVGPEVAIIQCGLDNPFGHPHQEVISLLKRHGVEIYRTDQQGTIVLTTDGKDYHIQPLGKNLGGTRININTASFEMLQDLPGIGPAIAKRIIAYREEQGAFQRIEEIKEVSGVGPVRFLDLKTKITVGEGLEEPD